MGDKKEKDEEEEGKNDESLILQKEANECQKYGEQILSDLSNPKTYKPFLATFIREKVVAWEIEKKRREATTRRSPQRQQQQMITPVAVFPKEELESSNNGDGSFLLFEDNTSSTPESVDLR